MIAPLALLVASCGAGLVGPSDATVDTGDPSGTRLEAATAGMCAATAALPDLAATRRAFVNDAHDALHALAADPRLTRSAAARVLEAMDLVERDFEWSAQATALAHDLAELSKAAAAALTGLAMDVPPCGP